MYEQRHKDVIPQGIAGGKSRAEAEKSAENLRFCRIDDYFWMPEKSRYKYRLNEAHQNVGDALNKALVGIESSNLSMSDVLAHIDFPRRVGQSKIPDIKLRQRITYVAQYRLRNEDLEFPDLLGAAYDYLMVQRRNDWVDYRLVVVFLLVKKAV